MNHFSVIFFKERPLQERNNFEFLQRYSVDTLTPLSEPYSVQRPPTYRDAMIVQVTQGSDDLPDDDGGSLLPFETVSNGQVAARDQIHGHVEMRRGHVHLLSSKQSGAVFRPSVPQANLPVVRSSAVVKPVVLLYLSMVFIVGSDLFPLIPPRKTPTHADGLGYAVGEGTVNASFPDLDTF